jgi:hypothetical protein
MNLPAMLAAVMVAITTTQHPTIIKANTRVACVLATPVDSATAKAGDEFVLRVNDDSQPSLYGAVIRGHITRVVQPHGLDRAEIAFLFDNITFINHTREPIRAYVISPNVSQRTASTPAPVSAYVPPGAPKPSTIVWQTQLGPKSTASAQTGGYAYASKNGAPIVAPAGAAVTLELASDLHTP